jgi:hypothetical protein
VCRTTRKDVGDLRSFCANETLLDHTLTHASDLRGAVRLPAAESCMRAAEMGPDDKPLAHHTSPPHAIENQLRFCTGSGVATKRRPVVFCWGDMCVCAIRERFAREPGLDRFDAANVSDWSLCRISAQW